MTTSIVRISAAIVLAVFLIFRPAPAQAQETLRRWGRLCEMQKEKFDQILPQVMRDDHIDMWIVAVREGGADPNEDILGRGYPLSYGYYVFTDRGGGRIERALFGFESRFIEWCGSYDILGSSRDLKEFVTKRDPKAIGIDTAVEIGTADGLTYSMHQRLTEVLGDTYARRFVSAEKLISEFRSRYTHAETVAFEEAGEISRNLAERALSNEVIKPGVTTLRDVASWLNDRLLERGLGSSFEADVYLLGSGSQGPEYRLPGSASQAPEYRAPVEEFNSLHKIQGGDLLSIDWGVEYLNQRTDMKRIAYVLEPGESGPPAGVKQAFAKAFAVRKVITDLIKPGVTAASMLARLNAAVNAMPGYATYGQLDRPKGAPGYTDVVIGAHASGDFAHGSGPSINVFKVRSSYVLQPGNTLAIEFFASTEVPEWSGRRVNIGLEDDAVLTPDGIRWAYPPIDRVLLIN